MIEGLKARHIIWGGTFLLIFVMTATADRSYALNWNIVVNSYNSIISGGKGLWSKQSELAQSLDKKTAEKFGLSEGEKRLNGAVTTPAHTVELTLNKLTPLIEKPPANRDEMIKLLGEPVTQDISGADLWLVEGDQRLLVTYAPTRMQLEKVEPEVKK